MNPKTIISVLSLLVAAQAYAQKPDIEKIEIEVSAEANLYFHEILDTSKIRGGAGIPPVEIDVRGVKMISFEHAEGQVTCFKEYDSTYAGADGGTYGSHTDVTETGALSGIIHKKKVMFLTGVILSDYSRLEPPYPADNYTGKENYEELYPPFDQVFFIGDGKTEKGVTQRVLVRNDATTMYIGFADCLLGPASNYSNNGGSIKITVVLYRSAMGRN